MRLKILTLSLLLSAAGVSAQPPYPSPYDGPGPGYAEQTLPNPAEIVGEGLDKLLAASRQMERGADPRGLLPRLRAEISPYIDFHYMADWVAGPYKRQMDPEQRQAFAARLQEMFLGALARHLTGGEAYSYRLTPPRGPRPSGETVVGVQVFQYDRPLFRVDFRLYWDGEAWKVFDVVAEGQSALQYYRQYFTDQVGQRGVDALLEN